MRRISLSLLVLCLAGCASASREDDVHILGIVTSSTSASTPIGRPGPFTLVGAAGGLVGTPAAASADEETHIHNRLYVKTDSGELTVDTDQYFPAGSCVEILPFAGERFSTFFPYNSARIVRSEHC